MTKQTSTSTPARKPAKPGKSDNVETKNGPASNPVGKIDDAHDQGKTGVKFAQLINHSYLTEEGFDVVAESLQRNLATTICLYLKLKKFHWDVRGRHFRDLHLSYDAFIEKIFPAIDEIAERLVMLGGSPFPSPADLEKYSSVKVPSETIHDPREQLTQLSDDLTRVAANYRDDSNNADDKAKDPSTSDMYNAILHNIDEVRWMIQALVDDPRMD